jgi:hypothetical protein
LQVKHLHISLSCKEEGLAIIRDTDVVIKDGIKSDKATEGFKSLAQLVCDNVDTYIRHIISKPNASQEEFWESQQELWKTSIAVWAKFQAHIADQESRLVIRFVEQIQMADGSVATKYQALQMHAY